MHIFVFRIVACVLLLCVNTGQAASSIKESASIKNIRVWAGPEYTRVVFDLDAPVRHNLTLADNPDRIILDVSAATLNASLNNLALAGTPIAVIRSSVTNKKDTQLVLDVNKKVTVKSFSLKKDGKTDDRLVLDIFEADALAGPAQAGPAQTGSAQSSNAIVTDVKTVASTNAAVASSATASDNIAPTGVAPTGVAQTNGNDVPVDAAAGNKVSANDLDEPVNIEDLIVAPQPVAKTDTQSTGAVKPAVDLGGKRAILIAVDAGHGGQDSGAVGPNGMREKDVTLSIAKELVNIINAQPGFSGRLTRSSDFFIPLQKRRNIARDMKADLFISIHADSFTNAMAKGASVFALSRKGATSEAARFLAQRENESDLIGGVGGVSLDDKDPMLAGVLLDLSMTATVNSSLQVGNHVLNTISSIAPLHAKHVEQAGFMVLKSPDVPSILVETGFISNKEEARKLASPAYRSQMAQSVFKGVHQYFMRNPPVGSYIAMQVYGDKDAEPANNVSANNVSTNKTSKAISERRHKVVRGDTLADIAAQYNVTLSQLRKHNGLTSSVVKVGQTIKIPAS